MDVDQPNQPRLDPDVASEMLLQLQAMESAIAVLRNRLLASAAPEVDRINLISVGKAGLIAGISDDRVRGLCREHPYPQGFGVKLGGRWQIYEPQFRRFLLAGRP